MDSIQQLTLILEIILVILVVVSIVVGIFLFWYFKLRKSKVEHTDEVDYSMLKRVDSIEYAKFDDIQDDMIITNNGTVFHAAIQCQGFDYFTASAVERSAAHDGYLSFINVFPPNMVYRQYTKSTDMDDTLKNYAEAYNRIETELFCASKDFDNIQADLVIKKQNGDMDLSVELSYLEELERLNELMDVLDWQRHHIGDNINYLKEVSSMTAPERVETYIFKWEYIPVIGQDMSPEAIYSKAKRELGQMASSYMHALSNAGVNSVRVNTNQLRQMMRRHWHPLSANMYKDTEVQNSDFYKDVLSAPAMVDSDYEVAEQRGVLSEVISAQEKLVKEGKSPESLTLDALLAYGKGEYSDTETASKRLSAQDINDMKIANKFKEREMQRIREDEERKKKESRKSYKGPVHNSEYVSSDIDFGGLGSISINNNSN